MQQLENLAYETQRHSETRQQIYVVGDLENLSATTLDYGTGGGSSGSSSGGGGGFGGLFDIGLYETKKDKGPSSGAPKPSLIGTFSDFKSASDSNLGPGVTTKNAGFLERYLPPHIDEVHGEHINLGSYLPDKKGKLSEFLNLHIDLNNDKK